MVSSRLVDFTPEQMQTGRSTRLNAIRHEVN
jgi:hypothetical protein